MPKKITIEINECSGLPEMESIRQLMRAADDPFIAEYSGGDWLAITWPAKPERKQLAARARERIRDAGFICRVGWIASQSGTVERWTLFVKKRPGGNPEQLKP